MNTLITASIDVTKIDKTRIIEGKSGKYINVTIWVNPEPDKYGNDVSIEQRTDKGEAKIYLGNGRVYKAKSDKVQPDSPESDDMPF